MNVRHMVAKIFGTDGVRGLVNHYPMTPEGAMRLGMATSVVLNQGTHQHVVVIGKDTRLSGYMLEGALISGFTAMGFDVVLLGPVPTPAVAWLVRSLRADLGVMISASHNPAHDNGIKLFAFDGFKLQDAMEHAIETMMGTDIPLVTPNTIGRARRLDDGLARYGEAVKARLHRGIRFHGLKVVVDCAHGAAYKIAPQVLWELGAEVISINVTPNGLNINDNSGAMHPKTLQDAVLAHRADAGIAFDGDADRLIMVDEQGRIIDGDQLLALFAYHGIKEGWLKSGGIAVTVMSNLGLEHYIHRLGLQCYRTQVGDRYVIESMRQHGLNLGGEQSGHLIIGDDATTGDGLLAAVHVLSILIKEQQPLSTITQLFTHMPQRQRAVSCLDKTVLGLPTVQDAVANAAALLKGRGRVLVRPSGTESKIRLMAEGDDVLLLDHVLDTIEKTLTAVS
jgi:phosphoglucosamine mutase